jgi:hypothetical protein
VDAPLTTRFVAHGIGVGVTADSAEVFAALEPFLPPLRTSLSGGRVHRIFHVSSGPRGFTLHAANRTLCASPHLRRVLSALEWEISLLLAERARDRIFVHAGVVEWRGKAIVVPGRSFSGKSTLVTAFVRAGCGYLSDEFAILDSSGVCHAHPRRLSLRRAGGIEQRTAEDLGGRTRAEPLPVGLIVLTHYRQGARWEPSRLSPGEGVLALLQHTVAARARSREALAVLRTSTQDVETMAGVRGDAADLVAALLTPPTTPRAGVPGAGRSRPS